MKYITKVVTNDGVEHESVVRARRHLEARLGEILTGLAHEAIHLHKYAKILEFFEAHVDDFARAALLKAEINTKLPEDVEL